MRRLFFKANWGRRTFTVSSLKALGVGNGLGVWLNAGGVGNGCNGAGSGVGKGRCVEPPNGRAVAIVS